MINILLGVDMVSKLVNKDVSVATTMELILTDNGRVELSIEQKGVFSFDTYNKMIDPDSEEHKMAEEEEAEITKDYEIFYSEEGVKKVRTAGGNVYPEGTPEYAEVTGEEDQDSGLNIAMRPLLVNIMRIEFPDEIIGELNEHIDESIIPNSESFANLVSRSTQE